MCEVGCRPHRDKAHRLNCFHKATGYPPRDQAHEIATAALLGKFWRNCNARSAISTFYVATTLLVLQPHGGQESKLFCSIMNNRSAVINKRPIISKRLFSVPLATHPIENKQERVRIESSRSNRGLGGVWLVISLLHTSTSIHTLYTHVRHIHITHKP